MVRRPHAADAHGLTNNSDGQQDNAQGRTASPGFRDRSAAWRSCGSRRAPASSPCSGPTSFEPRFLKPLKHRRRLQEEGPHAAGGAAIWLPNGSDGRGRPLPRQGRAPGARATAASASADPGVPGLRPGAGRRAIGTAGWIWQLDGHTDRTGHRVERAATAERSEPGRGPPTTRPSPRSHGRLPFANLVQAKARS